MVGLGERELETSVVAVSSLFHRVKKTSEALNHQFSISERISGSGFFYKRNWNCQFFISEAAPLLLVLNNKVENL
jgi:hypothetical protein